jgi:hypothetical protein
MSHMDVEAAWHDLATALWQFDMRMWDEAMQDPFAAVQFLVKEHVDALRIVLDRAIDQAYQLGPDQQVAGLTNVHSVSACEGQFCVVHNPSSHHMRDWPLHWRADRRFFERICPHGVGHPDPDQISYWQLKWGQAYADVQAVHGCEGCCSKGAADGVV